MNRATEVQNLLNGVQARVVEFIRDADNDSLRRNNSNGTATQDAGVNHAAGVLEYLKPDELQKKLQLEFPTAGQGQDGLLSLIDKVLRYSVNTWHQGFMDKLYASTNAPGVAAELVLAALNTNVHVYQVSPVLSVVEKLTAKRLASLFGLNGPTSGGISVQGGSASNTTAIVIARNTLFPKTKTDGNGAHQFVIFTSAHGHYSLEKAAQMIGLGSSSVWNVPVDEQGRMIPHSLETLIQEAKNSGKTPFFVNATAGTTVLGAFDPFPEIAVICRKYSLWMHIDGSWGGSFIFSRRQSAKLNGSHLADSVAINPHKMLGVPVTCSFLLAADLRKFHRANTLPAGYLFHSDENELIERAPCGSLTESEAGSPEVWDLADLTLQCGRRGDALKLFLSWNYYGSEGYEQQIDGAVDIAAHLAQTIDRSPDLILLSENAPPCLQVCFYYAPFKRLVYHADRLVDGQKLGEAERAKKNSRITETVAKQLINSGFMVDFAPPCGSQSIGDGKFFRCVVNVWTKKETVDRLVNEVIRLAAKEVMRERGLVLNGNLLPQKPRSEPGQRPRNPLEKGHGPVVYH
ncbi:hypothetical protein FQN57_006736 [Myotisia sp. PD_48]|nr:hypothetical protein FQN57_006736 [Myotisia sp. PD_48]